jgi:hypothetical protein
MNQPGFSASHAARLSVASGPGANQSLGVTGFGTATHDCGTVILHSPYARGVSGSSGLIPLVNPYSPSSRSPSGAHTGQSQLSQGHQQLPEHIHGPSQYNMYPATTVSDFLPFCSEPSDAMAASSFATRSWLSEDIRGGPDMASLLYLTGATSSHLQRFMPVPGPTASATPARTLYNSHASVPSHSPSPCHSSASQLLHSHEIRPTPRAPASPSQMVSSHIRSSAHRVHRGSFSYTTGPPQPTIPSTLSSHIPCSSLPVALHPGVHVSPHSNLVPAHLPHSRASTPSRSQAAASPRGAKGHSESPPMIRKRPHPHEETVEPKRPRHGATGSLSPPASFSETGLPPDRNHHAMRVPLPTHPPLFHGHITDPWSEAVPQPGVFDLQNWLGDDLTNEAPQFQ